MRTPTLGTAFYTPGPVPVRPEDIQGYLRDEFARISAAITALSLGHVDTTTVAPTKPRDGDFRLADGVAWDPLGTGKKFVGYRGGAWVLLG